MKDLLLKMPVPYEPKLANRWLIKFKGDYKDIPEWALSKTSRPSWKGTIPDKDINHGNAWDSMIGGEWADIEICLRDPIATSTAKVIMNAARLAGSTSVKKHRNKIKYNLELLDATGVVIEKWKIQGEVKLFDFGDLDYSKDSLLEIKLLIKPTKVKLSF